MFKAVSKSQDLMVKGVATEGRFGRLSLNNNRPESEVWLLLTVKAKEGEVESEVPLLLTSRLGDEKSERRFGD